MTDIAQQLKDKIAASRAASAPVAPVAPEEKAEQEVPAAPPGEEKTYQHYSSARVALRMITPRGKRINFVNHSFITDDEEIISYLDSEIRGGLNVISRGERMTHDAADPMSALKRKIIKEFLASQEKEAQRAAELVPDFGNTRSETDLASGVNPVTSQQTAS